MTCGDVRVFCVGVGFGVVVVVHIDSDQVYLLWLLAAAPFRPPADLLQCWWAGPNHLSLLVSSWSRSNGSNGSMGLPQREQAGCSPAWMRAAHWVRSAWCLALYPRCVEVPRLVS